MKKTICVALTNRTNYSKLKTVLFELSKYQTIDCHIVLSSSILLERYGSSYKDLEQDGFKIDKKIDCALMNDSHEAMAKTIGLSVVEHATYFARRKPDLLLIVGDRFDMLAPVVAAGTMNIPIAHIQGGELSGTIDDVIRDVLTKFSSLHFVATEGSAKNLIDFGIKKESVYNYGCPAVEYISKLDVGDSFDPAHITKKFKNPIHVAKDEKYFLVMVHPDTTNERDVDMKKVLDVISGFGLKTFIFYPNIDAHNAEIVSSIAKYNNNNNFFMIRHMPLEDFVYVMAHCVCMIGNSSSGIRESASFAIPFINIGERQIGRERNENTIDIGADYNSLEATIQKSMNQKVGNSNIYYQEGCSNLIANAIAEYIGVEK
ncbi:MAG: UDP-N-acetylglucosamine 2-epimerase (hydrolyzing) [Acidiferrobacteraceae bacterium]|nr:UDP-N-acetylglucosamine 2-epimerase (hydrolyzing) [Acidiferrobacteraceae bacterium]|tara:strand:- start:44 stop:1165 length:1122 start_codon:yes stop_codon:yes gene_type:complete